MTPGGSWSPRQGFGAALVELLRAFEFVPLDGVMDTMAEALHGSVDGAEERDALFGRCFTCACVVRCGRLSGMEAEARARLASRVS